LQAYFHPGTKLMMILIALGSSISAAAAEPLVASDRLPQLFVAACLDGRVAFSPGEASPIGADRLPLDLRKTLGGSASSEVWRLSTAGRSYLYVLNYAAGGEHDTKICGLASEGMSLESATNAVDVRMNGYAGSEKLARLQWLMPKDGYVATVTRSGKFNVAQINWLSESGRARIARQVRHVEP
jgi:hypothetical protein